MNSQDNPKGLSAVLPARERLHGIRHKAAQPLIGLKDMILKYARRTWVVLRILPPFFAVLFTRRGLFSPEGRQLVRGKARRSFLSLFPAHVRKLQERHGISGGCTSCGASCKLLFQCPHWNAETHLCGVYEDRPDICRQFPVTPADISDRNLILKDQPCGFQFKN